MLLKSLEIKNYRSLEHVKLDKLQEFNVLIGRNNAGKSSVFQALYDFIRIFQGNNFSIDVLTDRDRSRQIEINLAFTPRSQEREVFVDELIACGFNSYRKKDVLESPFFSEIQFFFKSPESNPTIIHLRETRIIAEDGQWAVIQQLAGNDQQANPEQRLLNLGAYSRDLGENTLDADLLNFDKTSQKYDTRVAYNEIFNQSWIGDSATRWFYTQLWKFCTDAFFFNPFRHSMAVMGITYTDTLAQDGSNLAQVLNTLKTNDDETFGEIENFVYNAIPDIGNLRAPLTSSNNTNIEFFTANSILVPLSYMGGGVEQLLMVATVLLMPKTAHNTLFVEEPESHLHAGAQRFLMEQLRSGKRQVFITTHSPTFINATEPFSLYQVIITHGRTDIKHCDAASLDAVLEDIGVRNSDVLLSDAVVFVEGQSDREVLTILSEKLHMGVAKRNMNVLLMHGGRHAHRGAPIRSDLLSDISNKAPIPHLFLLDRDERREEEIRKVETQLKGRVHFLQARELENYLLVPRAILSALKAKYADNPPMLARIDSITEEQVTKVIHEAADNLYGMVLLKRIRTEIGGLRDSLLPTSSLSTLTTHVQSPDLAECIMRVIQSEFGHHLAGLDIRAIVTAEKQTLDRLWSDPMNRLLLAPGEEILEAVYATVGSGYKKTEDAARIAREMHTEDIPQEIREVIEHAYNLTTS